MRVICLIVNELVKLSFMKQLQRHINQLALSVADLPFNLSWSRIFPFAKEIRFDGVEIVSGVKSTCSSMKQLPVLSIHQSFWSMLGIGIKREIELCAKLGADYVIHPIFWQRLDSKKTLDYLKKVSEVAKKSKVPILLENLPRNFILPFFRWFHPQESNSDLGLLLEICEYLNVYMVLDISHLQSRLPPEYLKNKRIWKKIKNIHISDYDGKKQHLPLGQGRLDLRAYILLLKKQNYTGTITFEFTPRLFAAEKKYFADIASSLKLFRKLYGQG